MAINIKSPAVEALVREIIEITGESKTEAIRKALEERRRRLSFQVAVCRGERLRAVLESEIWPRVPESELGNRWSKKQEEDLLGFGKAGA